MGPNGAAAKGRFFYGWQVVFAAAAIILLTGATVFYGFGVFFKPIVDEFGWSNTQVALANSLRSEVSAIAAPLIGFGIDRFGVRAVITGGILLVGAGFAALSQVWDLPSFYIAMCVIAIGTSSSGGSAGTVAISRWFVHQRSRALAFMTVGAGFGGVMVPLIAMLVTAFGWRHSLLILAAVVVALGVPLAQRMRDRPEDMGLYPDGAEQPPQYDATVSEEENLRRARERAMEGMTVKEAVRGRPFWQLVAAMTLGGTSSSALVTFQVPVLQHAGVSTELAALSVTGLTLLSVTGRLGFGWLGDFRDKRQVIAFCFAVQTVGLGIFAAITPGMAWLLLPFLLTFSPGFGGPIPLRPALMAEYFGLRELGSITGAFQFANTIGAVLGPLVVGYMFDVSGSYNTAFIVMTAMSGAAVPITLLLPRPTMAVLPGVPVGVAR